MTTSLSESKHRNKRNTVHKSRLEKDYGRREIYIIIRDVCCPFKILAKVQSLIPNGSQVKDIFAKNQIVY